jgi:aminopeptidase N
VPQSGPPESAEVVRAKSLLFFYALQDRYGERTFHDAIAHMLYARASRGFDIDDLIAAFEEEIHQNVAEFVRHWMKRPGVPADFRARYENAAAATAAPRQQPAVASIFQSKGDLP